MASSLNHVNAIDVRETLKVVERLYERESVIIEKATVVLSDGETSVRITYDYARSEHVAKIL